MPRSLHPSLSTARPGPVEEQRRAPRVPLRLPGRLSWLDTDGKTRLARVETRDVSALGAFIECVSGCDAIPLYRLVELRLDDSARTRTGVPPALKRQTVTAAIYRVGALDSETGQPGGYALRLLVKPDRRRQRGSRGASLRSL